MLFLKNILPILLILALTLSPALGAEAVGVSSCRNAAISLEDIELPAAKNIRTFYNGTVTVYRTNTEEPAGSPMGLALVITNNDLHSETTVNSPSCIAVLHFASVDLEHATAEYDGTKGLLLKVPTKTFDPETSITKVGQPLKLRVDVKNVKVVIEP